jgi:hypothetical protein
MSIDRLSSTSALIAALRSDVLRRMDRGQRGTAARTVSAERGSGSGAPDVEQLRRQLADIAQAIDPADAQAVRQARSRFVRAVLLWEFGEEFREHPEWRPLMDRIEQALDGDDAQNDRYMHLLTSLKPRKHK